MTALDAITALIRLGLTPRADAGTLYLSPTEAITPEAMALAREHKAAIIEALAGGRGEAVLKSARMEVEMERFFATHSPADGISPVEEVTFQDHSGKLVPTLWTRQHFLPASGSAGCECHPASAGAVQSRPRRKRSAGDRC